MNDTVAEIVVAVVTLIGVVYSAHKNKDIMLAEFKAQTALADQKLSDAIDKIQTLTEQKIDTLRKEVERHNSIVERTYHLEEQVAVHEEKIKVANKRIADIEQKG